MKIFSRKKVMAEGYLENQIPRELSKYNECWSLIDQGYFPYYQSILEEKLDSTLKELKTRPNFFVYDYIRSKQVNEQAYRVIYRNKGSLQIEVRKSIGSGLNMIFIKADTFEK